MGHLLEIGGTLALCGEMSVVELNINDVLDALLGEFNWQVVWAVAEY
jgi:hypothetical protein